MRETMMARLLSAENLIVGVIVCLITAFQVDSNIVSEVDSTAQRTVRDAPRCSLREFKY